MHLPDVKQRQSVYNYSASEAFLQAKPASQKAYRLAPTLKLEGFYLEIPRRLRRPGLLGRAVDLCPVAHGMDRFAAIGICL